jgi:hypothetical protein
MKNTLTVLPENNKFIIQDISFYLLQLFNLESQNKIIGSELTISFLINHLQLLENSTLKYIEFFYKLDKTIFKIQILKGEQKLYTIFLEDSVNDLDCDIDFENSCVNTGFEFIEKDKDLLEILSLRNKDAKTIQLEMIFLLRKIKEEITELQVLNKEQEEKFIEKEAFTFSFIIEKLGFKNLMLCLFIMSLIQVIFIEPFIQPVIKNISVFFEESFTEH